MQGDWVSNRLERAKAHNSRQVRLHGRLNSEGPGSLKAAPVSLCLLDAIPDTGGGPVLYQPYGLRIQQAGACEDYQLSHDICIVNDAERILRVILLCVFTLCPKQVKKDR